MNTTQNRRSRGGRVRSQHRSSFTSKSKGARFSSSRPRGQGRGSRHGGKSHKGGRKMSVFNPSQFINANPTEAREEVYVPKHTFDSFGLNQKLVRTITERGLTTPTPIQDQIIPEILKGRDVIGLAETGTGKTAAFLIPLIENTLKEKKRQTLILTPTRELALQIDEELKNLARGFKIYSVTCVGGVNISPQIRALKYHNDFIIGTPGRVLDLINRNHFTPANLTTVVLDEADRMLDMGFINDMRKILSTAPKNRETLLFSATMGKETEKIVHDFLRNPVIVSVKKKDVAGGIEQDVVRYAKDDKFGTLTYLLKGPDFKRILIFGAMKHSVGKLAKQLTATGIEAESIHGNKSHGQRQMALKKFKNGSVRILVATDVAARGIHVDNVSHVINYDLPNTFDDYVHRIGRTGRGSNRGKALTFIQKNT